jgi:hypothetical protein
MHRKLSMRTEIHRRGDVVWFRFPRGKLDAQRNRRRVVREKNIEGRPEYQN